MSLSRRSFLGSLGAASAIAVAGPLPALGLPEPQRGRASEEGVALLNSNENAYGMLPSAQKAAVAAVMHGNRYPDSWHAAEHFAAYHKVKPAQVIHGYGSSENIAMAIRALTSRSRKLVTANPTYELPGMHARALGVPVVTVPLTATYAHDLDRMLAAAGNDAGVVYICNPNNPTASITPRRDIEAFLAKLPKSTYVMLDEAYHHFATDSPDYVSFLDKPVDDPRLIVLRTFSKVYGMAGMRLGYSVQSEAIVKQLKPWQLELDGNAAALAAGYASLNDDAGMRAMAARIIADREAFTRQAVARKLKVIPSHANFIMVETGRPVRDMITHFRAQQVAIGRPFPPMEQYIRVSLGMPNEMDKFWQAWDQLPTVARQ
ncbi:MAG: pyridoxal phosphate-dependent aminotransferase [Terriglobales bacterium]